MTQQPDHQQRQLFSAIRAFLKDRFDLQTDKERDHITIAEISKGVEFKGTNLWILIFAIFIASIGLNVNSTAVIIGAMLISPLMGPIMGLGLGAGINDFDLIKKSARNLGIAAGISILTSTIYFAITPLHEAQSELLARTTPTLWDVLIALFGGLAGIVAGSRSSKSNAIPGVAIATALMPPLCTAGYGLANGNLAFFSGALFLFLINGVFIGLSTMLIVRFLKYPKKEFVDPRAEKRVRGYITFFILITVVPSAYLAYDLVRKTVFETNAMTFIEQEFKFQESQVIAKEITISGNGNLIEVTMYGKLLNNSQIELIKEKMSNYNLRNCELVVRQGYQEDNTDDQARAFEEMSASMRTGIIEDLYKKNEQLLETKDEQIKLLEQEIMRIQAMTYPVIDITAELQVQYPSLKSLAIKDAEIFNSQTEKLDTVCFALLSFSRNPGRTDSKKIEQWLKIRTKNDSLEVVFR